MIQYLTVFKIADNSGCKVAECIKIYKGFKFELGSLILVNIKEAKHQKRIKKSALVKVIIVRLRKKKSSFSGNCLSCSENAIVLVNSKTELFGSRIFGPIPNSLRKRAFAKLLSLACSII